MSTTEVSLLEKVRAIFCRIADVDEDQQEVQVVPSTRLFDFQIAPADIIEFAFRLSLEFHIKITRKDLVPDEIFDMLKPRLSHAGDERFAEYTLQHFVDEAARHGAK